MKWFQCFITISSLYHLPIKLNREGSIVKNTNYQQDNSNFWLDFPRIFFLRHLKISIAANSHQKKNQREEKKCNNHCEIVLNELITNEEAQNIWDIEMNLKMSGVVFVNLSFFCELFVFIEPLSICNFQNRKFKIN